MTLSSRRDTKAGRLDRIQWSLQFHGELSAEQRARLLEIAQMCPVHRTLRSEIHIPEPELVEDAGGGVSGAQ
jgi:putative redox protein